MCLCTAVLVFMSVSVSVLFVCTDHVLHLVLDQVAYMAPCQLGLRGLVRARVKARRVRVGGGERGG